METELVCDNSCFFFSPLFCFSFSSLPIFISQHHSLPVYSCPLFLPSAFLPLCPLIFCFFFCIFGLLAPSLYVLHPFWPLLPLLPTLSLSYSISSSLSQITVSVAQGRVQSPSPQPRYKSYAYTQAAYVKSPEQKRRRFTDQVRVS